MFFCRGQLEGEQLKLNRQFFDERWSKHRTVTSLDWSTQVTINNTINTTNNCINFYRNTDNTIIDDDDDDDDNDDGSLPEFRFVGFYATWG